MESNEICSEKRYYVTQTNKQKKTLFWKKNQCKHRKTNTSNRGCCSGTCKTKCFVRRAVYTGDSSFKNLVYDQIKKGKSNLRIISGVN